jgi:chaperonin cofactor prefoldin
MFKTKKNLMQVEISVLKENIAKSFMLLSTRVIELEKQVSAIPLELENTRAEISTRVEGLEAQVERLRKIVDR